MSSSKYHSFTCLITGHRNLPICDIPNIKITLIETIEYLITNHNVKFFGVGGAIGFDMLATDILFELRNTKYPHLKVILVYPFEGYTSKWNYEQKQHHNKLLSLYDKKVCISKSYSRESYLARDRHLVDHSKYCIAYCTRDYGGTAYTLNYARSKGLTIFNIAK